jgi:RNAse (barnase) inhibitor barstar
MPESPERQPLSWLRVLTGAPPNQARLVRGSACRSRTGLFAEWAAQLRFPEYFGQNWDALSDCLNDLVAEAPLTVVVDDAAQLLADEPPDQLRTLLTILYDIADTEPGRLEVILRCEPGEERTVRQRITAAAS